MSDIRKSLAQLADTIENLEKSTDKKPVIYDRELTGNKITGGKITNFSSQGIDDQANDTVVTVQNNGLHCKRIFVDTLQGSVRIEGDLHINGAVTTQDGAINQSRENSKTLELIKDTGNTFDEGIVWRNKNHTSQLVLKDNPCRIWTNENIDVAAGKEIRIANQTAVTEDSLGAGIVNSNIKTVGKLRDLTVAGSITSGDIIKLDPVNENISIGTEDPVGFITVDNMNHRFFLDGEDASWRIGAYSSSNLDLVTDDTTRLTVTNTGKIFFYGNTAFSQAVSIGVKNPLEDVDFTVAGSIRFNNKKQETGDTIPSNGSYSKGDIVWNTDPKPTGYVGWVCVREGTPGEWKPFGQISV